ncbi:MAG: hypothetical protein ACLQIB_45920 [Isosphaeraceae bacterium]
MTTIAHSANRDVLKPQARFLAVMGCAALALGAVLAGAGILVRVAPKSDLRIEPPTLAVGDLVAGTRSVADLRIRNLSGRALRVVGMEESCSRWGCFSCSALPVNIKPSEWGIVPIRLEIAPKGFTGGFTEDIVIYTDSDLDGRMVVHLEGQVVPK